MLTRQTHKKCIIKMSTDTLSKVLNAVTDKNKTTCKEVSKSTGLSEVTAGKVFRAIYASKLACKDIKKPQDGGRVCTHIKHSDDINFLIIDISLRTFSIFLITSSGKIISEYSYRYSDSLLYSENITVFLNEGMRHFETNDLKYSACAVITQNPERPTSHHTYGSLPMKLYGVCSINETVKNALGHAPDIIITPDVAIKQYFSCSDMGFDSAYIHIGSTLSMIYVSCVGNITVCKPWNIIVEGIPLYKYISHSSERHVIYTSCAKLINVLESTFSPKNIILQSNVYLTGNEFLADIDKYLRSAYSADTKLHILPMNYPLHVIGTGYLLRKHLFRRLITCRRNPKRN